MRTVDTLADSFDTRLIAFCFDHPVLFRRQIFPGYKAHPGRTHGDDPEMVKEKNRVREMIDGLWKQMCRVDVDNVFRSPGMESDDLMAKIARTYSSQRDTFLILVSSDQDLYQCLSERVILQGLQGKSVTAASFRNKYHILPEAWARVKAMAGCKTDGIKGIKGIGEVSALKHIRGDVAFKGTKAYRNIISVDGQEVIKRNRELVELPGRGCPQVQLVPEWSEKKWEELAVRLRIRKERR
jgi:DNA polymerase-1